MERYEQLAAALATTQPIVSAVVVAGAVGQKALFQQGELVYGEPGFWQDFPRAELTKTGPCLCHWQGRQVFLETLGRQPELVVCGGGHVSLPIVNLAKTLGFTVTVIDDRWDYANPARFDQADQVVCQPFAQWLAQCPGGSDVYFVIVTRGHRYDTICLEQILAKPAAYVGMMGSKKRVALVKQQLTTRGVAPAQLGALYSPIGLEIGAETPEELAVSILGQIIQVRRQFGFGSIPKDILQAMATEPTPWALATIVQRTGSAPRQAGSKMLVLADGRCINTLGGGCLEAEVRRQALTALDMGACRLVRVDISGRTAEQEGMVCGGMVQVFIDVTRD